MRCRWRHLLGLLVMVAGVVCVDWSVKGVRGWLWHDGVPHPAQRSVLWLAAIAAVACLVVIVVRTTVMTFSCGLHSGGDAANLIDLGHDGVVWNMIALPGTDVWCNVADCCIAAGSIGMIVAVLLWRGDTPIPDVAVGHVGSR